MKKIIIGFIVGALMFGIIPVMAEGELTVVPNPFPVLIDGVVTEVEGYNINGYTFLKLADFGKAGLTVKFNETDKQIEISSTKKAVITPEPIPDKGDDVASDIQVYEEGNYDVVKIDGVEYYCEKSIPPWYDLYAKGYGVGYDKATGTAFLMKYNGDVKQYDDYTVLLQNIPQTNYKGKTYIEKNFYINSVLPLIE
jgi:hypothetical protein